MLNDKGSFDIHQRKAQPAEGFIHSSVVPAPTWWDERLECKTLIQASHQYPCEFVGMYGLEEKETSVQLYVIDSIATPYSVSAQAEAVVRWAYSGIRVLATVHTHPSGDSRFSRKDEEAFYLWAPLHLVLYWTSKEWNAMWYHHTRLPLGNSSI